MDDVDLITLKAIQEQEIDEQKKRECQIIDRARLIKMMEQDYAGNRTKT